MILNLTQHQATPEQVAQGVVDLPADERAVLIDRLTVDALPTRAEIVARCADIAALAATAFEGHPTAAMIGGAPWMMSALEGALINQGIQPVYAFSVRESAEQTQPDGSVRKVNVFRHVGFVR
jgi:hypothetical protein